MLSMVLEGLKESSCSYLLYNGLIVWMQSREYISLSHACVFFFPKLSGPGRDGEEETKVVWSE